MDFELRRARERIDSDKFAHAMGIQLLELRKGYSKVSMTVTDRMLNLHNVTHGAAIFAIADAAFTAAGNSYGIKAVALQMCINYCSPAIDGGKLIAEAFEESLTGRIGLFRIIVKSDKGTLITSSNGISYRKLEESI